MLDHLDEPVVFLPEGTVALTVPRASAGEADDARADAARPGSTSATKTPDGLGLLYTAFVSTIPPKSIIAGAARRAAKDTCSCRPVTSAWPSSRAAWPATRRTDAQKAARIEHFLKHGEYTYSLEQPDTGNKWPLDVFLFEAKRGHCEYFSSAMAIMLRTLGIPTRNVTGFVGGQYNPYGGYYALRQGDAHSWVEVFVRGRGWVTYDPTPASRAEAGPREGLWSDMNAFIDAVRTRWMTKIVGYDLQAQVGLLHKMARLIAAFRSGGGSDDARDHSSDLGSRISLRAAARASRSWSCSRSCCGSRCACCESREPARACCLGSKRRSCVCMAS